MARQRSTVAVDRQELFQSMLARAEELLLTHQRWSELSGVSPGTISRYIRNPGKVDTARPETIWNLRDGIDRAEAEVERKLCR